MNKYIEGAVFAGGVVLVFNLAHGLIDYYRSRRFLIKEHAGYLAGSRDARKENRQTAESALHTLSFGGGLGARIALKRYEQGKFDSEIEASNAFGKEKKAI